MPSAVSATPGKRGSFKQHVQPWGAGYAAARSRSARASTTSRTQHFERCSHMLYERALELARMKDHHNAQLAFQQCVQMEPEYSKAWVSWAQMEKRAPGEDNLERCRKVLQRGLTLNPTDARLLQAWGLLELQRGNVLAAVLLLERCVRYDPRCSPVLRWKAVATAKRSVSSRVRRELQPIPVSISVRSPPAAWH